MAISMAGALGLALLWVLDVLVYHELLVASYVAGSKLERAFPWLPPVRSHFSQPKKHVAVRWYTGGFYIAGVSILCLLGALIGFQARVVNSCWGLVPLGFGVVLTLVVIAVTWTSIGWKNALSDASWIEHT